jgi:hypothetical protein
MCWAAEYPTAKRGGSECAGAGTDTQADRVAARPPLTPKQQAYARAEQARLDKEKRRRAAP